MGQSFSTETLTHLCACTRYLSSSLFPQKGEGCMLIPGPPGSASESLKVCLLMKPSPQVANDNYSHD